MKPVTEAKYTRREQRQRERRAKKQSDVVLAATVLAVGPDEAGFMLDDTGQADKGRQGAKYEGKRK